jgi:hypothetical protein
VTSLIDSVAVETSNFGYNDLDRLTSASGPVNEGYAYSPVGNLPSKDVAALSDPAAGQPRHTGRDEERP